MSSKHFNMGVVFGRVVVDSVERKSSTNSEFINFQVNVAGRRCGSVRAFCRIWKPERFEPLLQHLEQHPHDQFMFKGFFGQFWDDRNTVYATYTIYQFEARESDPRAAFILKGEVDAISKTTGGHRLLLNVEREGQDTERLELWLQDEAFLDIPQNNQLIEIKGYLRQEHPEDDFGGSSGPVRSYVEELKIVDGGT